MREPAGLPGQALPAVARAAIGARLGLCLALPRTTLDPRLLSPAASFVTLTLDGALRGCVGSLEARRPLAEDVEANGCAAAFEDTRFAPLSRAEYPATRIEVSVLGALEPLPAANRGELLRLLEPGDDGLVVVADGHRATFLPQVWKTLPEPRDFVDQLRRKAGLGETFWERDPAFFRYRVRKWGE